MPESKIVYVNEDSEDEAELIYGGVSTEKNVPEEESSKPPSISDEELTTNINETANVNTDEDKVVIDTKNEQQDEQEKYVEQDEQDEQEKYVDEDEDEEPKDLGIDENEDEVQENSMIGGEGYKSEPDDASSISSLDTDAILNVDPLYFRLTKFLQTGGSEPENVAEILKKINTNLELMNNNLMNLMNANANTK